MAILTRNDYVQDSTDDGPLLGESGHIADQLPDLAVLFIDGHNTVLNDALHLGFLLGGKLRELLSQSGISKGQVSSE